MAKFYSVAKLSERISETPEGFLVCEAVAITRAGDLLYAPGETPIQSGGSGHVIISRTVEDIHDPATIASFEGKPVTINHPDDFVTPDNWRELAVGVVQNVRPGEGEDADKLLADLLITDREAISAIKSKTMREVSCGYEAEYVEDGPGRGRQEGIIGNHVALVAAGRCGSECAIFDHAPKEKPMKLKDKLMGLFSKALDEAALEEAPAGDQGAGSQPSADERIAALEAEIATLKAGKTASAAGGEPAAEGDQLPGEGGGEEDPVAKRLSVIEAALAKLLGLEEKEHAPMGGEGEGMDMCKDAETIARAEILAPGIAKTADVKVKALDAAYGTEEGKAVIDILLAGKTMDQADKDLLFVASSEMLKGVRRQQLNTQVSLDSLPGMKAGEMTPDKINAMNAERYGKK